MLFHIAKGGGELDEDGATFVHIRGLVGPVWPADGVSVAGLHETLKLTITTMGQLILAISLGLGVLLIIQVMKTNSKKWWSGERHVGAASPHRTFPRPERLPMKRDLSAHQKQMRFMTVIFMVLAMALFVGLLYLCNL
jgi:hypothetical protein